MKKLLISLLIVPMILSCTDVKKENANSSGDYMNEPWRPQIHFSPESQWMNDPNGMVIMRVNTIYSINTILIVQFGAPCIGDMQSVKI